jgi:hypothetical protein
MFTKPNPPSDAQGNGTSFTEVNDGTKNTTQDWRNGGAKSPQEALSKSPAKNPVKPNEGQ